MDIEKLGMIGSGSMDGFIHPDVAKRLNSLYPSLKHVVLKGLEADAFLPALSVTLELYKYSVLTELPTQEAQLDYFGAHMLDLKTTGPGK